MRVFLTAIFLLIAVPVNAQVGFEHLFQGPWNSAAQSRPVSTGRSDWVPPRNAQCGWYLRRKLGHVADASLNLAQNWARKFRRTSAHAGAVVVWTRGGNKGHVAQIVSTTGKCRAVVHDNGGTYERDICRSVIAYVQP